MQGLVFPKAGPDSADSPEKKQDLSCDPNNIICINSTELNKELQSCVYI